MHIQYRNSLFQLYSEGICFWCIPDLRNDTRSDKFIPSSYDVCHILKRFPIFKSSAIPLICLDQCYVVASQWQRKWMVVGIVIVQSSLTPFLLISQAGAIKREILIYTSRLRGIQYGTNMYILVLVLILNPLLDFFSCISSWCVHILYF